MSNMQRPSDERDWRSFVSTLPRSGAQVVPGRDTRDGSKPDNTTPLALQFELREMIPRTFERWNGPSSRTIKSGQPSISDEFQIGTRPVLRTQRGWARNNLTWTNIGHQGGRLALDPAQQRWFRQFYAIHRAATTISVGQDPNWVFIDEFMSPVFWALLDQAASLGIQLVATGTHASVRRFGSAELALDLAADAHGTFELRPQLRIDGQDSALQGAGVIGSHGLYIAEEDGEKRIMLAPLRHELRPAETELLASAGRYFGFSLAEHDLEAFLAEGLPALRQHFQVTSSDRSVVLPEPPPATVVLTAEWNRGPKLTLTWALAGAPNTKLPAIDTLLPQRLFDDGLLPAEWMKPRGTDDVLDRAPSGDDLSLRSDERAQLLPDVKLRGADVAEFLLKAVPVLEQVQGLEVRVTGNPPAYRLSDEPPALTVTTVPSERDDWFDLGVLVTVEGKTVPFAPLFKALAQGKKKLLLVDDTFLDLRHPAFVPLAELIAEAQDLDEWETGLRISRYQAPLWAEFEDLADETVAAVEWRTLVREVGEEHPRPVDVPAEIQAELRPYQLEGFYWLAFLWRNRLGGILADDMGLGKTLQCLTLIAHAKSAGAAQPERRPFLVVAPTSVVSNWAAEAVKFAPHLRVRVRTAMTGALGRRVEVDAAAADIVITSYALFRLEYEQFHAVAEDPQLGFAGLILDEAQFVKNMRAQGNELAEQLPVGWKLAVTGTPMENSLRELHAVCQIVAPGLFPSARRFEEEYVRTIERPAPGITAGVGAGSGPETQATLRAQRTTQLQQRLRPFLLRRTKQLVASELPEKQEQVLEIELDAEHRELYDTFLQRERQKLYGLITDLDRNRFTVFRSLTLLRMLALDASLIDTQHSGLPSAKLDTLVEHLRELAGESRRTLVFSQFTSFLDIARERLHGAGIRTVTLDGSTRNRDAVIGRFRNGETDVFLISLKAGGVGLNLTEADTVFLLDPWWNPAAEAQAIDRTHRIGQHRPVHVFRMIAQGTIEEKVFALQQRKRALFDTVIDDADMFAQHLTADDVRELLG